MPKRLVAEIHVARSTRAVLIGQPRGSGVCRFAPGSTTVGRWPALLARSRATVKPVPPGGGGTRSGNRMSHAVKPRTSRTSRPATSRSCSAERVPSPTRSPMRRPPGSPPVVSSRAPRTSRRPSSRSRHGGMAGEPFDRCYHQTCDTCPRQHEGLRQLSGGAAQTAVKQKRTRQQRPIHEAGPPVPALSERSTAATAEASQPARLPSPGRRSRAPARRFGAGPIDPASTAKVPRRRGSR